MGENVTSTVQVAPGFTVAPSQVSFDVENWLALAPVMTGVLITRATLPVFVIVKLWADDELPASTLPKSLLVGLGETFCGLTVPVRATSRLGVSASSEGMASVALLEPADDGVKVTWMVQVPAAAMGCPLQVSIPFTNSDELVPDIATVPIVSVAVPELVTVNVWPDEAPTLTVP